MVGILKDIPIEDIKIVPSRVDGLRGIMKSFPVTGGVRVPVLAGFR
jgi:hypothetical protein